MAIQAASWLGGPVIGILVNWVGDGYQRYLDGKGNVFFGGLGDATGVSEIFGGSWSQAGLGLLQLAGTILGFAKPLGMLQEPISLLAYGPTMSELAAPVVNEARLAGQAFGITGRFFLNGGSFGPPPALSIAGGGAGVGGAGGVGAVSPWAGTFGGWSGSGLGLAGSFGNALFSLSGGFGTNLYLGGTYANVRRGNLGGEVHHMPAFGALDEAYAGGVKFEEAPGIWMYEADHIRTASWGSSAEAAAWREAQVELIEEGNLHKAIEMDIDDLTEKFGSKYNDGIMQYLNNLPADLRSRINVTLPI